jgi:uncharacterized protein (TIGR03435 family)
VLGLPVTDHTGLTGDYDIELRYGSTVVTLEEHDDRPSILTAIQEQLGLKLVRAKTSASVLVVRSIGPIDFQ